MLTWVSANNQKVTEECYLISDGDEIVTADGEDASYIYDQMAKLGGVVFQDKHGIFFLFPKQIIDIQDI